MDEPGTHPVWTSICLWACGLGALGVLHFLLHTLALFHIVRAGLEKPTVPVPVCVPYMHADAQRLPALCHVWGHGIFSESLSKPGAEGRPVNEMCPLPPRTHSTGAPALLLGAPWRDPSQTRDPAFSRP